MIARAVGWVLAFLVVIPPHFVATLLGRRDLAPPPFLGVLARISGARVRIVGRPRRHALLLANHLSWLDILALAGASRTAFVAQSGLAGHPFLKWLCLQNDTLFITRDQRGTVSRQVELVRKRLGRRRLTIFPEATTGDGTELLPFRSSLLSAAEKLPTSITVQPVALEYDDAAAIAWGDGEPGLDNLKRLFARARPIDLTIRFLEPLHGEELANRKTMAAAARAKIEAALRL